MAYQNRRILKPVKVEENWSYVTLDNGDVLQYKHVVMGVFQILDETGEQAHLPDGTPMYGLTTSDIICGCTPKSELQKRGN